MLLNAVLASALIAFVGLTAISAELALTRAAQARISARYLAVAAARGDDAVQTKAARFMQAGGIPSPLPTMSPLPPACAGGASPCVYRTTASAQWIGNLNGARGTCATADTNCVPSVQNNAAIDEGRLVARITAQVIAPDGAIVAARSHNLVLRTFLVSPYAAAVAQSDGDSGGVSSGADPCASAPPPDTVIHAVYRNERTGACANADRLATGEYRIPGTGTGWSP